MGDSNLVVGGLLAVVTMTVWGLVSYVRAQAVGRAAAAAASGREALGHFASQSLELESVADILAFAREAAQVIFGCQHVVAFVHGTEAQQWEAHVPGERSLDDVPPGLRGLFGWVKHNQAIVAHADLAEARFGGMRTPLTQLMETYGVDVILPLVQRSQVLAVLGLRLGRRPTALDREQMRLFRLQATAACANVRLHREAAQVLALAQEVDLASAVRLTLVPESMEGEHGGLRWAGHFRTDGVAGSDFFSAYPLDDGRLVLIIGDATGDGLAGSMLSAVVKSCADAIFASRPSQIEPAALLGALNRALYRSSSAAHASCFCVVLDPGAGVLRYGNAGHTIPYRLHARDGQLVLGSLSGAGPLLGDAAEADYRSREVAFGAGEGLVLYTNGLVRVRDQAGRELGERGVQKLLAAQAGTDPEAVRTALVGAIDRASAVDDDIGFIVVEYS